MIYAFTRSIAILIMTNAWVVLWCYDLLEGAILVLPCARLVDTIQENLKCFTGFNILCCSCLFPYFCMWPGQNFIKHQSFSVLQDPWETSSKKIYPFGITTKSITIFSGQHVTHSCTVYTTQGKTYSWSMLETWLDSRALKGRSSQDWHRQAKGIQGQKKMDGKIRLA